MNIKVLRELDELVEAARLLGATQAKRGFGCHTDEDRRFERAMYESIDKHRAAIEALQTEVERLRPMTAMTMGIGNGDGNLFVHGDYDSIKAVQALVFRVERLTKALRLIESAKDRGFGIDYARGVAHSVLLQDHEESLS